MWQILNFYCKEVPNLLNVKKWKNENSEKLRKNGLKHRSRGHAECSWHSCGTNAPLWPYFSVAPTRTHLVNRQQTSILNCNFEGRRTNALSTCNAHTRARWYGENQAVQQSCLNKQQPLVWAKPRTKATNAIAWQAATPAQRLLLLPFAWLKEENRSKTGLLWKWNEHR